MDLALNDYLKSLEYDSSYKYAICNIGDIYAKKSEYNKALEYYDKALEIDSNYEYCIGVKKIACAAIHIQRGTEHYNNGKLNEALGEYNKALEYDRNNKNILKDMGKIYLELKDYANALKYYNKSAKLGEDSEIYIKIGDIYFGLGDYSNAIVNYSEAIKLEDNRFEYYVKRGEAFEKLRNNIEAERDFKKANSLNPQFNYTKSKITSLIKKIFK